MDGVDRLLHDESLRRYTRIGGLFTLLFALLFAQPLSRIVAIRTSQVGGWAIDLHLGRQSRAHADVDVLFLRAAARVASCVGYCLICG